jgi:sec-independent protein translocase protein TatA
MIKMECKMGFGTTELLIIFGIVLLVFGAGKIPKLAKDLGSGIKEFKKSLNPDPDPEKKDSALSDDSPKKSS